MVAENLRYVASTAATQPTLSRPFAQNFLPFARQLLLYATGQTSETNDRPIRLGPCKMKTSPDTPFNHRGTRDGEAAEARGDSAAAGTRWVSARKSTDLRDPTAKPHMDPTGANELNLVFL